MNSIYKSLFKSFALALMLVLFVAATFAQGANGSLRGQIKDEFGGAIVGATVTVTDASGAQKSATSNAEGVYIFNGLAPGAYTLRAQVKGFADYENAEVEIAAGRRADVDITLSVTIEEQKVTVAAESPVSTDPENNANQIVISGKDLDALPDDPDELAAALQALAGPSAGPNGGQIFIDGFTGGRLPPKESIREIRINQNPFTAENDRPGGGRIDIFTKPGTDKMRGSAFFNFSDESFNSRNPFVGNRAPYQLRQYGGNLSGPIIAKKASFFLDFERRETDDNDVINAQILDPALNPTIFSLAVLTPSRFTTFSPRLDYQLNANNTLVARYTYLRVNNQNLGINQFSLPSRAFDQSNTQQTLQLTETAIINAKYINETRLQYIRNRTNRTSNNADPALVVADAFTGGGPQLGLSFNNEDRWELSNNTTWTLGHHALKAGARVRGVHIKDVSESNFGGTYIFAGGFGPALDQNNQPLNGQSLFLTSLERYRRTLLFQRLGRSPVEIRARGGGASQLIINGGNPEADVSQIDFGGFVQDDWRIRPNFTLSLGLRYENQTNISSSLNFGPRIAFAWSPGGGGNSARPPKTVIRGGFGVFYDRFNENLTLTADRFNGINQQRYIISSAAVLDQFPNIPSTASLAGFAVPQATTRVADNLQTPYTTLTGINIERQLPKKFTVSLFAVNFRTLHVLRSRNINAPLPGTISAANPRGVRPMAGGDIYEYESSGKFNLNQVVVSVNNRFNPAITLFANYVYGKAKSDTDGPQTFPANQYDLSGEYSRASFDIRHRFFLGGTFILPWQKISLNPFIVANTGRAFNITTGRDTNFDGLFTERPSLAPAGTDCANPGPNIRCTPYGNFNLAPAPGDPVIARNFAEGPAFVTFNIRVGKTFSFGELPGSNKAAASQQQTQQRSGRNAASSLPRSSGGGSGAPGGIRGGQGGLLPGLGAGASREKRYNLTFSLNFQNIFNRTNPAVPSGNLSSPLFGVFTQNSGFFGIGGGGNPNAGNRRVTAQLRFNF